MNAAPRTHRAPPRAAGFSLIEFMIAITVSMLILSALTATFVASSRARTELERANIQIENGRYAIQVLSDDFKQAGYLSHFNINDAGVPTPATLPDPCATTNLTTALPLHVQGYNNAATVPTCLSDVKTGTDIVVIRRVASCIRGVGNCTAVTNAPYFQASLCNNSSELASVTASGADQYRLSTTIASLNRTQRDCVTQADIRQYLVHIYFIANNDQSGDGIPTLKMAELGAGSFSISSIADGIDNLQLEYGIDTNADGVPDAYDADPGAYNSCAGQACVDNWRNVMAVRVYALARNIAESKDYTDTKTYALGAASVGPLYDHRKRHVYATSLRLLNPAGRRS